MKLLKNCGKYKFTIVYKRQYPVLENENAHLLQPYQHPWISKAFQLQGRQYGILS